MSSCCQARKTGPNPPDVNVTMENVGGGAEWYVAGSGPNPFQIRTATSTGGTVTITEVGDTLNFEAGPTVALANEGGSAEAYDTATSTPSLKNIRTFYSSDSTVTVTQEALRINLKSPLAVANEGGSAESYDTATSTATTKNFRTFYSSDSSLTVTQEATRINLKVPPGAGITVANEGGSSEAYDTATSTATTKNFRTFYSSDSTVTVTQEATRINLKSPLAVSNEGGSAEPYDTATSTATSKVFRTFYSSDSTVTVTQEATRINLKVATPAVAQKEYYEESNASGTTNNTSYVTLWTSAAMTGVANGETWEVDANVLICQPSGLTTVNNMTDFQIETSAGVFTSLETNVSSNIPITITAGQRSVPHARIFQFVASMATPRFRIRMAMSAAVATGAQWEYPRIVAHKKLS